MFLERCFSEKVPRATKGDKKQNSADRRDMSACFGGRCGRRVPSEEPKGIPGGPLRAQGAAQGRPRNLWQGLGYLLSVQKALWGVRGGESISKNGMYQDQTRPGPLARRRSSDGAESAGMGHRAVRLQVAQSFRTQARHVQQHSMISPP